MLQTTIRQPGLVTAAVVIGLFGAFATAPACGAAQRTFVASFGLPANTAFNCSLAKPCRAFNEAIGVTSPGGEVVILDTAGYGPMTITQSIKIIGPSGVYGGISVQAAGTDGLTINAGDNDVITLRGLDVTGLGGLNGINIINAGVVHIEKSTIGNFTQDASACISVNATHTIELFVVDSFLRECRTSLFAVDNFYGNPTSVTVDNVRFERTLNTVGCCRYAILTQGNVAVAVRNSSFVNVGNGVTSGNGMSGILARVSTRTRCLPRITPQYR